MAVRIRLSKFGKTNAPAFKIVAATKRDKLTGKYLDVLGTYNPSHSPEIFEIDKDKYEDWLSKGAKPSKAVEELVAGEYEFQHYTRQNEEEEGAEEGQPEEGAEAPEESEEAQEAQEKPADKADKAEETAKEEETEKVEEEAEEETAE